MDAKLMTALQVIADGADVSKRSEAVGVTGEGKLEAPLLSASRSF